MRAVPAVPSLAVYSELVTLVVIMSPPILLFCTPSLFWVFHSLTFDS